MKALLLCVLLCGLLVGDVRVWRDDIDVDGLGLEKYESVLRVLRRWVPNYGGVIC